MIHLTGDAIFMVRGLNLLVLLKLVTYHAEAVVNETPAPNGQDETFPDA